MKYSFISRQRAPLGAAASLSGRPFLAAAQARSNLGQQRGINLHHLLNWPGARGRAGRLDYVLGSVSNPSRPTWPAKLA